MSRVGDGGRGGVPESRSTATFPGPDPTRVLGGSCSDRRVAEALERYLAELEAGRRPDRAAFLAEHAEIAPELAECLDGLELVRSAAIELADLGRGEGPLSSTTVLGDFRILREVGRGGMGVVYEAEQISLGRRVALKVLPFAASLDPRQQQRFRVEAQAAALLHHTHIVPVFAVGNDRGVPFYAMQFIDGRSLAAIIDELQSQSAAAGTARPGPIAGDGLGEVPGTAPRPDACGAPSSMTSGLRSRGRTSSRGRAGSGGRSGDRESHRMVARLGLQAAEALAHAHGLGVVHRDIKPANLLVDGAGMLWITDFGLARIQDAAGPTRTGDLVGTVRYMSPEQAGVVTDPVDHRSDLYSLGATLYELLTLRPAFDGKDRRALLRQIAQEEPPPPRRLDPSIPKDLETVVLKALSKEPRDRYADAPALADDLRRFLDDRPILARRPRPLERLARWGRRHRALVATATISLVSCMSIALALLLREHATTRAALRSKAYALADRELAIKATERARRESAEALRLSYGLMQTVTVDAMGQLAFNNLMTPERYATAIDYFDRMSRLGTSDPELLALCADAARWAGYLGAARQLLLVQRDLAERGWDPEVAGDYLRSIGIYERLARESPGPEVDQGLAIALDSYAWWLRWAEPAREAEAERAQRRSLDIWRRLASTEPVVPGASRNWVEMVLRMESRARAAGRPDEADALHQECLATLSDLADAGTTGRALAAGGYRRLAAAEIAEGNREEAIALLRTAVTLAPGGPEALNDLAWALVNAPARSPEQMAEAIDLARRAVALAPENGPIRNTLAVILYRDDRIEEAEATVRESIRLSQGEVAIDHFLLALILHRRGDPEGARAQYDQGVDLIGRRGWGASDHETSRFRDEAAAALGLPADPKPPAKPDTTARRPSDPIGE